MILSCGDRNDADDTPVIPPWSSGLRTPPSCCLLFLGKIVRLVPVDELPDVSVMILEWCFKSSDYRLFTKSRSIGNASRSEQVHASNTSLKCVQAFFKGMLSC